MRYVLILALAATALTAGGCNVLAFPLYVFAQQPMKSVPPEFNGLGGKYVALVVHSGPEVLLDYPTIQLQISEIVAAELRRHVRGISFVTPPRVIRYQSEDPRWDALPPERLCKTFDCDYVLLITLVEFAAREMESLHLARGRMQADVKLYGRPGGAKPGLQWSSKQPLQVMHPPADQQAVATADESGVQAETIRLFAEALARKFYKHKVPIEP